MTHHVLAPHIRFHVHIRRDHATGLVKLANSLTQLKGRDTRPGETLELALDAGLSGLLADLLKHARDAQTPITRCNSARSVA